MNINLTLIVQMLVFALLVWFTMRFVWPIILGAMEERARKIAHGLAAAEQGQKALDEARVKAEAIIRDSRERANHIIDQAQHRASDIVEQAKTAANAEGDRLVASAHQQIALEAAQAREALRREVGNLAVRTASKLIEREIDPRKHADLIEKLAAQI
jgi:F-type H+-transporting ATPase subunit b